MASSGLTGTPLKYGPITGSTSPGYPVGLTASQRFYATSGKFVTIATGTGYATLSTSASTLIFGWADVGSLANDMTAYYTSSSTDGADVASIILASDCVFRIPVSSGTFAVTSVGVAYDLAVSSYLQGVAVGTASYKLVIIVGGDLVNNTWVDVIMNPYHRAI
jgi:hypothetical protein